MTLYIATNPRAEVSAEFLLSFLRYAGTSTVLLRKALDQNGLPVISPTNWYSQQSFLNALRELESWVGAEELCCLGEAVGFRFPLPVSCRDVQESLHNMGLIYRFSHRGSIAEAITHIPNDDHSAKLISETPYPDSFEQGIFLGITRRYILSREKTRVLIDLNSARREMGDSSTTYLVHW